MSADEELAELWRSYGRAPNQHLRDQLILQYAPLVKYVASRVAAGLPQSVEQADLSSYGMFGLMDAIEKFEPERGYKFETYAIPRIRGAILDELRSIDWVPRTVRAKARTVERAISDLESTLHRTPSDEELAEHLEMSVEGLHDLLNKVSFGGLAALDELVSVGGDRTDTMTLGDTIADAGLEPGGQYEVREMRQILAGSINGMPEREKIVLTLYYYEGLTLSQIGEVLDVTESRVCQIHTKAVLHLRSRLNALERERS